MKPIDSPQLIMGDLRNGVITSVSSRLAPSSVNHAVNFEFDSMIGEATARLGTSEVGTGSLSGACYGLFNFVDSEGGENSRLLYTGDNGITYYLSSVGVWTSGLTGDTVKLKTRYATFLDRVVRVNGTDAPKCWNGATASAWETTGGPLDIGNMPTGKFVIVYKDEVITAGVSGNPDTLYISSTPDSGTGNISWTTGNREIVVDPDSNGNITAVGKVGGVLVILKDDGMYRWNNRATDPDQVIDVGCSSQESVCVGGQYMTFWNRNGAWVTQGEYPTNVSKRIEAWVDLVSDHSAVTTTTDGEHYFYSVGDIIKNGRTYYNVVFRWSIGTQEWAIFSYAKRYVRLAKWKDENTIKIVGGTSDALVHYIDDPDTNDDAGTPIQLEIESQDIDFGSRAVKKQVSDALFAYGENMKHFSVTVKAHDGIWQPIGNVSGSIDYLSLGKPVEGNVMRFRLSGQAPDSTCRFSGLELPKVTLISYGKP